MSAERPRTALPLATVLPPDEPERERDKLCHYCATLPSPPQGVD